MSGLSTFFTIAAMSTMPLVGIGMWGAALFKTERGLKSLPPEKPQEPGLK